MQYLSEMTDEQTLTMYSGHPMGLFLHKEAPRVVVTNGMVIPNYSKPDDWKNECRRISVRANDRRKLYVHWSARNCARNNYYGTKCFRKIKRSPKGGLFITSGLGGMSGAQPKRVILQDVLPFAGGEP
jgi:urocanate hydratase